MTEPKAFASLSSSLLARKGQAKPAMRPQAFHLPGDQPPIIAEADDLGWNDMGDDVAAPFPPAIPVPFRSDVTPEPMPSPAVEQQEQLSREFAPAPVVELAAIAEPDRRPSERKAPGSKTKAAFTLRLDTERHLRLRLVCAVMHRSAQQVVTQALDEFLARQPANAVLSRNNNQ